MPKFIYISGDNIQGYTDLIEISAAAFNEFFPEAELYSISLVDDVFPPGEIIDNSNLDNFISETEIFTTTLDEIT